MALDPEDQTQIVEKIDNFATTLNESGQIDAIFVDMHG